LAAVEKTAGLKMSKIHILGIFLLLCCLTSDFHLLGLFRIYCAQRVNDWF